MRDTTDLFFDWLLTAQKHLLQRESPVPKLGFLNACNYILRWIRKKEW